MVAKLSGGNIFPSLLFFLRGVYSYMYVGYSNGDILQSVIFIWSNFIKIRINRKHVEKNLNIVYTFY